VSLDKVIEEYQAPFFYYDLDGFEAHLRNIKAQLHPDVKIWYACKANPLEQILSILNENGFGVDVASLGELHQAKSAGVKRLISTGPAKSKSYLGKLLDKNIETIVIESENQLKDLNALCEQRNVKQKVLLRVQLDWSGALKSVLGGSAITPFGLGVEDWKKISLREYPHLEILGLHCFQWGNILDLSQLKTVWETTISTCVKLAQDLQIKLDVLDLGGGLGVDYKGDRRLSFSDVHELLLNFKSDFKLNEIWLELGRFSIAEFGTYCTPIVDLKSVRGKNLIVTEGGINHIARPALVNEAFPCRAMTAEGELETFAIHGPLCTALDFLGDHQLPKSLKPGDWLKFEKAGAYGFTESMPYFLCHAGAGEAVSYRGDVIYTRHPEDASIWMK
jgi:diaminopimelate decarboxylase